MEQGVAVISGNLPMLAPLFDGYFRNRSKTKYGYKGSNSNSSGTHSKLENSRAGGAGGGAGGGGGLRLNWKDDAGVTRVSSKARDQFDRLSDNESQTNKGSEPDLELDDRAILVKTQVSITQSSLPEAREMNLTNTSWLKR